MLFRSDALATAFMILGIEKSLEILEGYSEYAAYFIYDKEGGFAVEKSSNWDCCIIQNPLSHTPHRAIVNS